MNELPKQRPYTIYEAFEEERAAKEEERAAKEKAQQFLKDYRNKEAESSFVKANSPQTGPFYNGTQRFN